MNMWDTATMPAKAVQVSIDDDLLKQIDADSETRSQGRSAFIRTAIQLYLREKQRRQIDEALRRGYAGKADALQKEVEPFLAVQAWPEE